MLRVLLLFSALIAFQYIYNQDIKQLRSLYIQAGKDRERTEEFVKLFKNTNNFSEPLLMAYYGTALAMKADIVEGKYTKYKTFVAGREKIEEAIKNDIFNVEIRYLRFSVQSNLPAFLFYDNREEDKQVLLKNLDVIGNIKDNAYVSAVWQSLLNSESLSESEKLKLRNYINLTSKQ